MSIHIPKIIHQIWVGPNPLPPHHKKWIASWKKLHPEWEHRLWDDDQIISQLPEKGLRFFRESQTYAGKADAARVWLLHKFGGVYVDTDFQCLKPIDELLHGCRAFTAIARYDGGIMNGLFGSVPNHPFLAAVKAQYEDHFNPNKPNETGPLLFTKVVQDERRDDVRIFERDIFMPVTWKDRHRLESEKPSDWQHSYAVHHFAESWVHQGDEAREPGLSSMWSHIKQLFSI